MKAMYSAKYGSPDVLHLRDIEKPTPKDNELLIKIHASSVNALDWHFLRATPFLVRIQYGLIKPKNKVLGYDIAGVVESTGKNVTKFKPGDKVFGGTGFSLGAFAEYVCVKEDGFIDHKPENLTFEQAGAIPTAGITAFLSIHERGKVKAGDKVLINGASGAVGTFSVQLAKYYGAEVTAVCSAGNHDMVKSIGADHVIDYSQEDFTKKENTYDVIIDNVGNHSVKDLLHPLVKNGIYAGVGFTSMALMLKQTIFGPGAAKRAKKRWSIPQSEDPTQKDLIALKEIVDKGKVSPVIDRRYSLEDVPEAIRYLETGHAKAKVVINIVD